MAGDPPIKLHRQRDGAVYLDPLYGHIPIPSPILKLIDLPTFQRLRGLKQLSTIYLTLPGATHTRFEHSIGTYFLASRAFSVLQDKILTWHDGHPHLSKSEVPEVPGPPQQLAVQIAALLHDIGHGPFCHVFDMFLDLPEVRGPKSPASHDYITKALILGNIAGFEDISEYLDTFHAAQGGPPILLKENIASLALGETPMKDMDGTEYRYLAEIVSSSWGVDRLDYLRRDSYHTGIETGRLDIWTIIDSYTLRRAVASNSKGEILKDKDGREYDAWNLGVEMRAASWLEAMLDTRDQCYRLLYFSKSNRIAVSMLVRAMYHAFIELKRSASAEDTASIWQQLWAMTDEEFLMWAKHSSEIHDPLPGSIASRIQRRQLYEALPAEIVSSGGLQKKPAGEGGGVALHELIVELPFEEKDITRLRKFQQEGIGTLFDVEQAIVRELPDVPSSETVILDIHTPPFEPESTFTSRVLEDNQRGRYYSLLQVLPHLRATKIGQSIAGGTISPYNLHARFLRRIRIYVPPRMLVAAITRVFLKATAPLSSEEEVSTCLQAMRVGMETIAGTFASAVGIDTSDGEALLVALLQNLEVDIRTLLHSLPFRLHIAQVVIDESKDYSEAEKARIKRVLKDLVRLWKQKGSKKQRMEILSAVPDIAKGGGGAILRALRALLVDFVSETAVKLLKNP